MDKTKRKGITVVVAKHKRLVIVEGKEIPFPPGVTGRSIVVSGTTVTIDGYRLQDGEWVKPAKKPTFGLMELAKAILFG